MHFQVGTHEFWFFFAAKSWNRMGNDDREGQFVSVTFFQSQPLGVWLRTCNTEEIIDSATAMAPGNSCCSLFLLVCSGSSRHSFCMDKNDRMACRKGKIKLEKFFPIFRILLIPAMFPTANTQSNSIKGYSILRACFVVKIKRDQTYIVWTEQYKALWK